MHRSAFTLIELLVVIAILSVLAVVVVLTLNPAGLLAGARDSNRLSDMATLTNAANLFSADVQSTNALGQSNVVYVSVPDPSATSSLGDQCQGLGLPALPAGYTYQCTGSNFVKAMNGTGWLPLNFASATFGAPLSSLPVDPTNATSSGLYYTYVTNGTQYEITSLFEAPKNKTSFGTKPILTSYPELDANGSNLSLNPLWNPSGLVGYWNFDEGTGSTTLDLSGNGNNGSWNGSSTNGSYYAGGKVGGSSGVFNGGTTYISLPATTPLQPTNVSLSMWVYEPTLWLSNYAEIGIFNGGGDGYVMYLDHTYFDWNIYSVSTRYSIAYNTPVAGQWYLLTGTFNGSVSSFYQNGQLVGTTTAILFYSSPSIVIGYPTGPTLPYQIDDVRIYNRALSAGEVQALYNSEK